MTESVASDARKPVLDPIERLMEILFGLIMVLTFTGSLSAAESGRLEVRTMLVGAIGCNLAWGLIDAIMYLMAVLSERGQGIRTLHALRRSTSEEEARRTIADALPPIVAKVLKPQDLDNIRDGLARLPEPAAAATLRFTDFRAAAGVFLLVFLSTFPVILPFLFPLEALHALRLSNAIAIVMLFILGCAYGKLAGYRPWVAGGSMVALGLVLVALTIALGG